MDGAGRARDLERASVTVDRAQSMVQEVGAVLAAAERLFGPAEVEAALDRMATEIGTELADRDPVVLCAMVGGVIPTGLLLPRLAFPVEVDYLHVTRYRGQTSGGTLSWFRRPDERISGRTVLIVDDVLDEGYTLRAMVEACRERGASAVYSAVLVVKAVPRSAGSPQADFAGLLADDRYLFGYGMDYKNYLRNAAGIYALGS
jgi:hypoxanthine phosphoribosyltransferase